jgi:hypothetical protein
LPGRKGQTVEFLIVLWDFEEKLTQGRSVSPFEAAKPVVLVRRQDYHRGLSTPCNLLGFAGQRGIDQRTELVLGIL